jgi:hypothetical protein
MSEILKWENNSPCFDDKYKKLLSIVKRAANNSCCICCDKCLACDANDLLKELNEEITN